MFNFIYKNETTQELLSIVNKLNFKGYEKHFFKNSNGDYNHLQNFFIWKKKGKKEYIRITLQSNFKPRMEEEHLFFWNLEPSFKPNRYKHNHRAGANLTSDSFKTKDKYIQEFLKVVKLVCIR